MATPHPLTTTASGADVRVRFCPSPTGLPHVGTVRTALQTIFVSDANWKTRMAAYNEAIAAQRATPPVRLTRREIQCLKWAAAGKTDAEIGDIVQISLPTVRFHITNAARKLDVSGRSQAVHRAATLGYIGSLEAPRPQVTT